MAPYKITFLRLVAEKIGGKCHSSWEQKVLLWFSNFAYKRLMSPTYLFSLVLGITSVTKAMSDWEQFSACCCEASYY